MNKELLQQCLNRFEHLWEIGIDAEYKVDLMPEIRALRAELAKPEQEPQMIQMKGGNLSYIKKPWVGLTDDEIHKIINDCTPNNAAQEELNDFASAVRFVEAKLKEKNHGSV